MHLSKSGSNTAVLRRLYELLSRFFSSKCSGSETAVFWQRYGGFMRSGAYRGSAKAFRSSKSGGRETAVLWHRYRGFTSSCACRAQKAPAGKRRCCGSVMVDLCALAVVEVALRRFSAQKSSGRETSVLWQRYGSFMHSGACRGSDKAFSIFR